MAGVMLIRPGPPGEWSWIPAAGGADAAAHGSPAEAARAAAGQRVVVLVPGTEVSLEHAAVPVRSRRNATAAIPWALEDRLVDDVESLHFAVGTRTPEERWPVAVVARADIDRLLGQCTDAGLEPHVLLPEPLGLPLPEADTWVALEEPDRVTVRSGTDDGFACEPGMLATVLGGSEAPQRLIRYRAEEAAETPWPAAFAGALDAGEQRPCREPLAAFARAPEARINLLQGPYAKSSRHLRHLRQWLLPAALAAGVAVVALAHATIGHLARLEREERLRDQMERIYRQVFPDAERVVDPRAQMEGQLDQLEGGGNGNGDFLTILGRAAPVLSDSDAVRLTELEWREGIMDLALRTDRLDLIDRMQQESRPPAWRPSCATSSATTTGSSAAYGSRGRRSEGLVPDPDDARAGRGGARHAGRGAAAGLRGPGRARGRALSGATRARRGARDRPGLDAQRRAPGGRAPPRHPGRVARGRRPGALSRGGRGLAPCRAVAAATAGAGRRRRRARRVRGGGVRPPDLGARPAAPGERPAGDPGALRGGRARHRQRTPDAGARRPMRRAVLLLGAALAGLAAGLVAHFPAGHAFALLAPPGITAEGVRGSVWQGSASRVDYGGPVALTSVRWDVSPLALYRGRLALETGFDVLGGHAEISATVARDGDATVREATFRGPASGPAALVPAPLVALDGELVARVAQGRWTDRRLTAVRARVLWDRARVRRPVSVGLGSVTAEIRPDDGDGLQATVGNRDGDLGIDGEAHVDAEGRYRLRLRLQPGPDTPADVRDLLERYAERDDGDFVVRASGRLRL
ncbi:MAG: type II secretion system protein GspL [Halofilum sp. (in: g-proteobacteria)]|nr:type II secretion system protein GspL [Halofilum sp. (in: g-proteobacteria)]